MSQSKEKYLDGEKPANGFSDPTPIFENSLQTPGLSFSTPIGLTTSQTLPAGKSFFVGLTVSPITITLPANPADGMLIFLLNNNNAGDITLNCNIGQEFLDPGVNTITITARTFVKLIYFSQSTRWAISRYNHTFLQQSNGVNYASFINSGANIGVSYNTSKNITMANDPGPTICFGTNNNGTKQTGVGTVNDNILTLFSGGVSAQVVKSTSVDHLVRANFLEGAEPTPSIGPITNISTGLYFPSAGSQVCISSQGSTALAATNTSVDIYGNAVNTQRHELAKITNFLPMEIPSGAVNAPSIRVSGSTTTGIYSSAVNRVGFTVNGSLSLNCTTTAVVINQPLYATDGTAASPSHTFNNQTGTGMSRAGGQLTFSNTGTTAMQMSNTVVTCPLFTRMTNMASVTQLTSNSTTVTSDTQSTIITMFSTLASLGTVSFNFDNTLITTTSLILLSVTNSGAATSTVVAQNLSVSASSTVIQVTNLTATTSGTIKIKVLVVN